MALSMLETIEAMSVSVPLTFSDGTSKTAVMVLYAPGNSFARNQNQYNFLNQKATTGWDASDVSSENNASLFAGLHILYCTLLHMLENASNDDRAKIDAYKSRVYYLLEGIAIYFQYLALCSKTIDSQTYYYLTQGGSYMNGQFYKNDTFALDCQTWPLLAFMSMGPKSRMNIDNWWSATAPTITGDYSYQNSIISGFRTTKTAYNSYTLWLNTRQLFGTNLSGNAPSTSSTPTKVTSDTGITGVGYTIKKFYGASVTNNSYSKSGSVVFSSSADCETNTCVSGEWTAGAIFAADVMVQKYGSAVPKAAADSVSMFQGLQKYVYNVLPPHSIPEDYPGINAYAYSSERVRIPFGWNGVAIPSMASTSWMVMNAFNYNPFGYGGLLYWAISSD
jgi:hypothetical protein